MSEVPSGTHNEISGLVTGSVVQAGNIHVHVALRLKNLFAGASHNYLDDDPDGDRDDDAMLERRRTALADELVRWAVEEPERLRAGLTRPEEVQAPPVAGTPWYFAETHRVLGLVEQRLTDTHTEVVAELARLRQEVAALRQLPAGPDRLVDLGHAPVVDVLYGRRSELATLHTWLAEGRQVVVLTARGGMGKTALAARLVRAAATDYDVVVWRSVYNCEPLTMMLRDLLALLIPARRFEIDAGSRELRLAFMEELHVRRCLIVLDNVESLLAPGERTGRFLPEYNDYDEFLSDVAGEEHRGHVLITTREVPASLAQVRDSVRVLRLEGLDGRAGLELIESHQVHLESSDGARIIETYGGNPLELIIAADHVRSLYHGDVKAFLAEGVATGGDTHSLLTRQIDRLEPLARDVLGWLAVCREAVTIEELASCLIPPPGGKRQVLEAVAALVDRSLAMASGSGRFGTQPVIAELMVERLLEALFGEIQTTSPDMVVRFALVQGGAKDYVRSAQTRVLLRPLADRLQNSVTPSDIDDLFRRLLNALRTSGFAAIGYGAANILHVALRAGVNLTGYDFSHLTIRHAYLQGVSLHDADFRHARFMGTVFTDTFGAVRSVAASPDGHLIAAGTDSGDVRLWRIADGGTVGAWREHVNSVCSVAFSPDSRWLASAAEDRTVRLWELRTGRCVRVLRGHEHMVVGVAWHPTLPLLATAGYDNTVRVWNSATGDQIAVLTDHDNWVRQAVFSADGALLISCSLDGTVRVWSTAGWSCLAVLSGDDASFWCVAVSPDSRRIAAGDYDGWVWLWRWPAGDRHPHSMPHADRVWSLAFLPDRPLLLSASGDHRVRAWDHESGVQHSRLEGHRLGVTSVCPVPGTSYVVSGGYDQTVRVWDVQSGMCHLRIEGFERPLRAVAWSPAGLIATAGSDGEIDLWAEDGTLLTSWPGHSDSVDAVTFDRSGERLASAGSDHTIRLWDVATGRCLHVLTGHEGYVSKVAFSPDGQRLASGGQHRAVMNWDTTTGRRLYSVEAYGSAAGPVRYTPDGRLLITGGGDHRDALQLRDPDTGRLIAVLRSDNLGAVNAVAVTADGRYLVAGLGAGVTDVWDLATRHQVATFTGHTGYVRTVACHPDNRTVITAGDDRTIRIWRIGDDRCLGQLTGHTQGVGDLAFSADGRLLISAGTDGTARMWRLDGTVVKILVPRRPYEGIDITGAAGLTGTQREALRALGARDVS